MTVKAMISSRAALRLTRLLGLAGWLTACGDNDALPPKPPRPIPGCEAYELTPCDAMGFACQVARLQLASCLRGIPMSRPPTPPPVTIMTEQEYVDYRNALFQGQENAPTNHFEVAMTWLGLAESGSFAYRPLTIDDVTGWFGTYRWREDDLLLIDHGRPADDAASNVELVEALIRTLRDRELDIGAWSSVVSIVDVDSRWGGDAIYFGEARFYANRYQAALEGYDLEEFDQLSPINRRIREDIDWIVDQPSTFVASNERFPDNFGARAAYLAYQRGGVDGVSSLFDEKRLTQQLMASETEELVAPRLELHGAPRAPEAWYPEPNVTAIGAWGLFLSLSRYADAEAAFRLALEWRGDQVYVYKAAEPGDETALVWQVEVGSDTAASSLERALAASVTGSEVRRRGTFVTLAIATDETSLEWAFVDD